MADPLSISASVLAVVTAALQSTKSLYECVQRFKSRDKTLQRLQAELDDLKNILASLEQALSADTSVIALLRGPIDRCSRVCHEFEESMQVFAGKSKTGFRDWTKMEFMRGGINEFIDIISGYKSTIAVGLGIITMHATQVSHRVLKEYNEMVHDTTYTLELRLQRIDEMMAQLSVDNNNSSQPSVDLKDERDVTKQCLRVCEDARSFIESLASRKASLLQGVSDNGNEDVSQSLFEAQLLTRQTLNKNLDAFVEVSKSLRTRLESLVTSDNPTNEGERSRLQDDINTSKQCLEVCKMASEISHQRIYRIGEVVAEDESDQVVVTTLADLFDIKKALSRGNSAQLIGSMTAESLRHLAEKRYTSRFGAPPTNSVNDLPGSITTHSTSENQKDKHPLVTQSHNKGPGSEARGPKPHPNEMRRRMVDGDQRQRSMSPNE